MMLKEQENSSIMMDFPLLPFSIFLEILIILKTILLWIRLKKL